MFETTEDSGGSGVENETAIEIAAATEIEMTCV